MKRFNRIGFIICLFFLTFLFLVSESQCQYSFPYNYGGYWQHQYDQPYQNFFDTFIWDIKLDYLLWNVEDNYQLGDRLHNDVFNYAYGVL